MAHGISRRDALKMSMAAAGFGMLQMGRPARAAQKSGTLVRAGIVTDMHYTTKEDSDTRRYSAAMKKMRAFADAMAAVKPAFVVELGDFVDTLSPGTDPLKNLAGIEKTFTSISCPHYHVLGNHDFDNLRRDEFLGNISNTGIPQGQTWYSWDAGGVHFVVLDADYTPGEYRPYDMNTPEDTFWNWTDTVIPPQELEWLRADLKGTDLPTILFSHQTLDRVDDQDHNIKNASVVRGILEESGRVLAVISGHDHQGGYSNIKGIHYVVLNGNVGVSDYRAWAVTSSAEGLDEHRDNQFVVLEVSRDDSGTYTLKLDGYGRQPSYVLERSLEA